MVVGQKIKALDIGAQTCLHRGPDGTDIVAQMGCAGRCDAGQKTLDTHDEIIFWNLVEQQGKRRQDEIEQAIGQRHQGLHPQAADNAGNHQTHDDEKTPGFNARDKFCLPMRQQADQDATAIERRQRNHVENE